MLEEKKKKTFFISNFVKHSQGEGDDECLLIFFYLFCFEGMEVKNKKMGFLKVSRLMHGRIHEISSKDNCIFVDFSCIGIRSMSKGCTSKFTYCFLAK